MTTSSPFQLSITHGGKRLRTTIRTLFIVEMMICDAHWDQSTKLTDASPEFWTWYLYPTSALQPPLLLEHFPSWRQALVGTSIVKVRSWLEREGNGHTWEMGTREQPSPVNTSSLRQLFNLAKQRSLTLTSLVRSMISFSNEFSVAIEFKCTF